LPTSRANTLGSVFSDRGTAPSTIRAKPQTRLGLADRGQALVGTGRCASQPCGLARVLSEHDTTGFHEMQLVLTKIFLGVFVNRHGPGRPSDGMAAPMGGDSHYKSAFKTSGSCERSMPNIDFAHCKNMKGRFDDLSSVHAPPGAGHCSYGAARNCQVGAVRPQSARGMPSFSTMCMRDLPAPPTVSFITPRWKFLRTRKRRRNVREDCRRGQDASCLPAADTPVSLCFD
jgi:hypothetical protein